MFVLLLLIAAAVAFLLIRQAAISIWAISYALMASLLLMYGHVHTTGKVALWMGMGLSLCAAIPTLRRHLMSQWIMPIARRAMPKISATEREALEAGTVTWEGDLFSGRPDFNRLRSTPTVALTADEQAFLDGPTQALCRLIDDWEITHQRADLSPLLWDFIKKNGFLGMIIPKTYGGLGFSATAQMSILVKLYGRSISVATTIAVPNSLGPAELLLNYGTDAQKDYYLPRLARGEEIPCFALTGPEAGSDAASIPDQGIVCYRHVNDELTLGIELNWNKRYITLCPVATVIGLAFRLFDPDNLLGKGHDIGITCALIPAETPGVIRGRRHFPLNIAFLNGPTQGKNVFIPMDYLIGGMDMVGCGWRMLMECLSAGRAISLPSSAMGGAQAAALATGAYARVRKQFQQSIASFEGIEAPLARIAGNTYLINAALTLGAASIDHGAKPSVAGAILKYHTTERARQIAMDAMDIHGGKGICLGPQNYLGRGYQGAPISITVEGANILSRNLIIFGQGAIRCHPYVYQTIQSIQNNDLIAFDQSFWGHVGFGLANFTQTLLFLFTKARLTAAPAGPERPYYQKIRLYSSQLAFLADFSMILLGQSLKRKEMLSARLGDVLSNLYLASAVLKKYHDDGEPLSDKPLVDWSCQSLFYETAMAIEGIVANFPGRGARFFLKILLQPLGLSTKKPSDQLGQQVAHLLIEPSDARSRLTHLVFHEALANCPLGRLEETFIRLCSVSELEQKVMQAFKKKALTSLTFLNQIDEAHKKSIINTEEAHQLREVELARQAVLAVDDFSSEELKSSSTVRKLHETAEDATIF
jgi:acyl-CoA dehydrogenase